MNLVRVDEVHARALLLMASQEQLNATGTVAGQNDELTSEQIHQALRDVCPENDEIETEIARAVAEEQREAEAEAKPDPYVGYYGGYYGGLGHYGYGHGIRYLGKREAEAKSDPYVLYGYGGLGYYTGYYGYPGYGSVILG